MHSAARTYGLLVLLLFHALSGQPQSFTTKLYTTADGLNDNYILCIYQDSYGYLWTGTVNGLSRFDGKRFVNYGLKNGLPSLYVDRVYEDRYHRLWIGTRKGIAELKGDSCYTYPVDDKKEIDFVSGFIETDKGSLWATTDKGVYAFNQTQWRKINLYPGKEDASVGKIIQTADGLFINYNNNSVIHQKRNGQYALLLTVDTKRPHFNNLFQRNDTVYISTYSGLQYWNGNTWVHQFTDTLARKYIYTSYCDKSNRFWFGTREDGVLGISVSGNKISYDRIPLPVPLVSNFLEDRDQNIWVAGFRGLLKITPSPYRTFSFPAGERVQSIRQCIALASGNLLLSCENGSLLLIRPSLPGKTTVSIAHRFALKEPGDFIDYYTTDERDQLWFTTRRGGLYRLAGSSLTDMRSLIGFRNDILRGIAYDRKSRQLFVCGDSVLLYGNEQGLDTLFGAAAKTFIPLPSRVYVNEKNGSLLVQTLKNGLQLVTKERKIQSLGKEDNLSRAVLVNDKANAAELWGAHQGSDISRYRWKGPGPPELAERITDKEGLTEEVILSLAVDREDKLWIATPKGVTVIRKNSQQQWVHQPLAIGETNAVAPLTFPSFTEDTKGNMWMNLDHNLIMFDKDQFIFRAPQVTTVIEKVLLFDRQTNWLSFSDSLESYRDIPVGPVLPYHQNSLSIVFNSLAYNNYSQPEYSYRLLPADSSWSHATASNMVSFYQLSPGTYRFEVKSHSKGFDWGNTAVFLFTIRKPFWKTWWFRVLLIVAVLGIILFIFRFRLQQLREKARMQNQVREMEIKALKAQMNPHFIHNALNSIQSLIINNKGNEASHYISKFARLLRQVLENADAHLITLDKELYSLQLYVDLEMLRMNTVIAYEEHIDENIVASQIKIPPLILQPFVENALWHGLSNKQGEKKIILSIKEEEGWIICTITDNGIGRKQAAVAGSVFPEGSFSKAVHITTERLADFNQSPGTVPVSFIDLTEEGRAAGTTVIVRIKNQ